MGKELTLTPSALVPPHRGHNPAVVKERVAEHAGSPFPLLHWRRLGAPSFAAAASGEGEGKAITQGGTKKAKKKSRSRSREKSRADETKEKDQSRARDQPHGNRVDRKQRFTWWLQSRPERRIVVVSHHNYLKALLGCRKVGNCDPMEYILTEEGHFCAVK